MVRDIETSEVSLEVARAGTAAGGVYDCGTGFPAVSTRPEGCAMCASEGSSVTVGMCYSRAHRERGLLWSDTP